MLAVVVFQLIPGAGTIAILNSTARNGVAVGMAAVLGTLLGDLLMMLAAVAGLAAIMQANPRLFDALQWSGAAYLCWMGVQLVRKQLDAVPSVEPVAVPAWIHFRQAFTVSLTNPKVILFFVAFFPLFIEPEASGVTLAVMMAHVTLLSLAYQTILVFAGDSIAACLKTLPSARRTATRLAGVALIAFGIKLAINNR
ncbi:MAG: LysE family transporter [Steroidobacteraceae bacterium]